MRRLAPKISQNEPRERRRRAASFPRGVFFARFHTRKLTRRLAVSKETVFEWIPNVLNCFFVKEFSTIRAKSDIPINLGAAIIVKDAEKELPKALASIADYCSQIAIVDTGSRDDTPKIASRFGAELYFFEWTGDFSAARNRALKFIRTDWTLVIDSDEELDGESLEKNFPLFETENLGALEILIENSLPDGSKTFHKYPRIFKNHPKIRFEGKIHEQIAPSILSLGLKIIDSSVKIRHRGYKKLDAEKIERNRRALLSSLRESPADDFVKYHLAETEFAAKNFPEAEKLFLAVVGSFALSDEQRDKAKIRLAQINLAKNEFSKAAEFADFSAVSKELESLRLYVFGVARLMSGDLNEAEKALLSPDLDSSSSVSEKNLKDAREALKRLKRGYA